MVKKIVQEIEREQLKKSVDDFKVGDLVKVHTKIREGDKERVQVFAGTVIGRRAGAVGGSFTVRRMSHGVGVEKVFPIHSPAVARIEVERSSKVRRAKLYYLRERTGKKARLKEKARK